MASLYILLLLLKLFSETLFNLLIKQTLFFVVDLVDFVAPKIYVFFSVLFVLFILLFLILFQLGYIFNVYLFYIYIIYLFILLN